MVDKILIWDCSCSQWDEINKYSCCCFGFMETYGILMWEHFFFFFALRKSNIIYINYRKDFYKMMLRHVYLGV